MSSKSPTKVGKRKSEKQNLIRMANELYVETELGDQFWFYMDQCFPCTKKQMKIIVSIINDSPERDALLKKVSCHLEKSKRKESDRKTIKRYINNVNYLKVLTKA